MARDYHMLIAGRWIGGSTRREVKNKYDGSILGTIPLADAVTIDQAIAATGASFENANPSLRSSDAGPILTTIVPGGQGTSTVSKMRRTMSSDVMFSASASYVRMMRCRSTSRPSARMSSGVT